MVSNRFLSPRVRLRSQGQLAQLRVAYLRRWRRSSKDVAPLDLPGAPRSAAPNKALRACLGLAALWAAAASTGAGVVGCLKDPKAAPLTAAAQRMEGSECSLPEREPFGGTGLFY